MNPLRWIRSRLTVRLTLTMLLVSLGPLAVAAVVVPRLIEESLRAQLKAQHDQLAAVSATNVYHYVEGAVNKLRYYSAIIPQRADQPQEEAQQVKRSQYEEMTQEQMNSRLGQVIQPSQEFVDLNYQNRAPNKGKGGNNEGRAQRGNLNPEQQREMADWTKQNVSPSNDIARQTYSGQSYVGPQVQRRAQIVFLPIAVPVREGEDIFGTLTATLDFAPVEAMLKAMATDGRTITLKDAEDNVVVASGAVPAVDVLRLERPVGQQGWRVEVTEPREEAFRPLAKARMQAVALIGGTGAAAFALSLLLAAWILRPVRRLTAAADAMKDGALGTRSGIARDDEIGRLAQSFDRMAASLEELDRMKGEFVAHVSHELRTPLTAMQLSVANLQDGVVAADRQKEVLDRVGGDIERLIKLVNEVLDIARIEAGRLELTAEPFALDGMVREAVEKLRPLAERKGVKLQLEGTPATFTGDRAKLHQVVTNLVDNAIKFTPAGGRVGIVVGPGRIAVLDTGAGIAAEHLPRIFDRFARAGAVNAGAGLGLSITKKIVELHGGAIAVESAPGKGTTFTVTLPCPASSS